MTVSTIPSPLPFCILISKSLFWCINSGGRVLEEAQGRAKRSLLKAKARKKLVYNFTLLSICSAHSTLKECFLENDYEELKKACHGNSPAVQNWTNILI